MPGVVVSTAVRTGPSSATVRESSQLFVVGMAERGPSDEATLVESLADFEYKFGGFQSYSYLHPTIETFFEEGGTQAYVSRVVGPAATTGTKNLLGISSASATTVMTLDATGPGDWSDNIAVWVSHPTANTNFKITLYYDGAAVYNTGTCTSLTQAAGRINTSTIATRYVTATVASGQTSIPATLGSSGSPSALSAGDDDRSNVTSSVFVDGLDLFNDALGTGAVAIVDGDENTAGETSFPLSEALITHANEYNRVALIHAGENETNADAIAKASDLQNLEHAEHAAIYHPWIDVPTDVSGVTRRIPPTGYVAAKRALAHNQTGPHVAPAGLLSVSRFATGVATDINKVDGDALDDAGVNAVRIIQNSVRIYGARSLSTDEDNFRYITTQDIVNTVVVESKRTLEDLVFSVIDGRDTIFAAVTARLIAVLAPLRDSGALFQAFDANGKKVDSGYTVRCDAALNPVSQLAGGTVKAKVGIRTSSVGDKIEVDIVKSNLTATVVQ